MRRRTRAAGWHKAETPALAAEAEAELLAELEAEASEEEE